LRRIAIFVFALVSWSLLPPAHASSEPGLIIVRGSGAVEIMPDIADIVMGVQTEALTPTEAVDANSEAMRRVVDDAQRAGVDARDVQTNVLDLAQFRDGREVRKFRAVNTVRIRVHDLPRLGAVIRNLVGSGANELRAIRFSAANPSPHLDRARQQAVEDAKRRAEVLAAAAGRRLGDIFEITEETYADPGIVTMGRAQRADIPVETGQLALRASVQIKWRLLP
jgi:uncharacterized protein